MKKEFLFSVVVMVFCCVLTAQPVSAQSPPPQKQMPPLLLQQPAPAPLPPANPPVPAPPGLVPPSPPAPGIPVVCAVPAAELLRNLQRAVATVRELNRLMRPGKVWVSRGPSGELEVKAGILYQGIAIGVLRINPENGSILPLGIMPCRFGETTAGLQSVKAALQPVFNRLKILPYAEFIEPESCWSFPLVLDNRIVARVKIYFDGVHVMQDAGANREMLFYGR
ncbi:MAG: hypothetical protein GXO69_07175 [Acidobacteria bacterium]|nr:hypothetical protein [Acidobacteriota bacterium]